jgi:transposase-like protein
MLSRVSQSNVRQRTDQIDVFTTEDSCLTLVWATIQDIRLHPHLAMKWL